MDAQERTEEQAGEGRTKRLPKRTPLERLASGDFSVLKEFLPGPLVPDDSDSPQSASPAPQDRRRIRAGDVIGRRYRVERQIGSGGEGRVYKAHDTELGRDVAIKLLAEDRAGEPEFEERFRRESQLLAALSHPNIVRIYERGDDEGMSFLVMELVDGRSVAEVLGRVRKTLQDTKGTRQRPGDPDTYEDAIGRDLPRGGRSLIEPGSFPGSFHRTAARIAVELARTLEAAHGAGVVHRDLNPKNVMLRGGGWPVILDFGLGGRLVEPAGKSATGLGGTPAYLAPEQIRNERTGRDPRVDVYQVGLILYELLTLEPAFRLGAGDGSSVYHRVMHGIFKRPRQVDPRIPPTLEAVCLKAMELSLERRYATAQELREDLERFMEGRTPLAGGAGRLGRAMRAARYAVRRRPVAGAAAASLAIGATGVALAAALLSEPSPLVVRGALRMPDGAGAPLAIVPGSPVFGGDWLGVEVETEVPAVLYALSISGDEESAGQYVTPILEPGTLADLKAFRTDDNLGRWAVRIPAGRTAVGWSKVDPAVETEGLLVIASVERIPLIEEWLDRLWAEKEQSEVLPGVPRERSEQVLAALGRERHPRGGSARQLPREELERRLANLSPAQLFDTRPLDLPNSTRFLALFPVREEQR